MDDLIIEKINNGYVLYYTNDVSEIAQKVYFSDKETLFNFIDQILE
jgi:hypothetical protein